MWLCLIAFATLVRHNRACSWLSAPLLQAIQMAFSWIKLIWLSLWFLFQLTFNLLLAIDAGSQKAGRRNKGSQRSQRKSKRWGIRWCPNMNCRVPPLQTCIQHMFQSTLAAKLHALACQHKPTTHICPDGIPVCDRWHRGCLIIFTSIALLLLNTFAWLAPFNVTSCV